MFVVDSDVLPAKVADRLDAAATEPVSGEMEGEQRCTPQLIGFGRQLGTDFLEAVPHENRGRRSRVGDLQLARHRSDDFVVEVRHQDRNLEMLQASEQEAPVLLQRRWGDEAGTSKLDEERGDDPRLEVLASMSVIDQMVGDGEVVGLRP